jgi:hypothetical protein
MPGHGLSLVGALPRACRQGSLTGDGLALQPSWPQRVHHLFHVLPSRATRVPDRAATQGS